MYVIYEWTTLTEKTVKHDSFRADEGRFIKIILPFRYTHSCKIGEKCQKIIKPIEKNAC